MAVNQVMNNQFEKPYFQLEKQESIGNFKQVYYIPTLEDKVYEINELNDELLKELPTDKQEGIASLRSQVTLKVSKNLLLLISEISKEIETVKSIKFEYLDRLSMENYDLATGDSVLSYLERLNEYYKSILKDAGNKKENLINEQRGTREEEKEYFLKKLNNYNEELTDLVKNASASMKIIEYNGSLIQKLDPIYLDPANISGLFDYRTHFYAPKKHFAGKLFDTFYFNVIIIWIMVIALYITLYF